MKGQYNFWQQNAFLTCSWRFLRSKRLEQLEFKLEKLLGLRNMEEKLENEFLRKVLKTYAWFSFLILIFVNSMNLQNCLVSSVTTPVFIFSRYIFSGYTYETLPTKFTLSPSAVTFFLPFFHCLPHLWS